MIYRNLQHHKTEDKLQRLEGINLDYLMENFETQLDKRNIVDFNISMLIIKIIRAKPLRYCNGSFPLGLIMDFRMGEKIIIMQHKAHTNIIITTFLIIKQRFEFISCSLQTILYNSEISMVTND
ncbi:hypothetical protein T10_10687 [Trichinella papuae]|uniref:Uncharacterized protein n=1 Tax=Trichinella papuae TaxID=268474 RepID=A0A0V1M675_9BILA|nr:hypothetical protein T10_10687 [Trichinella papuae]